MQAEVFVSPRGSDVATGAENDPFQSPARAAEALQSLGGGAAWFAPGRYELARTLRIGPRKGCGMIVFRASEAGSVIFDGGRRIGGWRESVLNGRRAWLASLPEVRAGRWFFRQLFVDGERRTRARLPKFDIAPGKRGNLFRMEEIRVPDTTNKMTGGDYQFRPRSGDIKDWPSLYDAEIVVPHFWLEERMTQPRLRPDGWVESARRSIFALSAAFGPELAQYYIDNLFEALTEPGEWFLDRHAGILYYLPRDGESMESTRVVAPALQTLLEIRGSGYNETKQFGDPCMDDPAGGIEFRGIEFQHADWMQPNPAFAAHDHVPPPERPLAACGQSACDAPAAISLRLARDVVFENCSVRHVGGYAIGIGEGCRSIDIRGCEMTDLGGGGVRINGAEKDGPPWRVTGHCSITDNRIEGGGRVFHAGAGILAMNTLENVIAHNHIRDLFYSGISVGWSWGYKETVSRDNLILCNVVEEVGQGLLSDLGAIYILGVQPGTVVRGNVVAGVARRHYGSVGIYLDEGASHIVVEENLVRAIEGACANIHFGRENIIRSNRFEVSPGAVGVTIGKTEAHIAANIFNNLFLLSENAALFGGGYKGDPAKSFVTLFNRILTPAGQPPVLWADRHGERPFSWGEWRAGGMDEGSLLTGSSPAAIEAWAASGPSRGVAAWRKAGPRPADERTRLAQPLTREDRPAA